MTRRELLKLAEQALRAANDKNDVHSQRYCIMVISRNDVGQESSATIAKLREIIRLDPTTEEDESWA